MAEIAAVQIRRADLRDDGKSPSVHAATMNVGTESGYGLRPAEVPGGLR